MPGQSLFGRPFLIQKVSFGYVLDFAEYQHLRFGVGGVISRYALPATLHPTYGDSPDGYSVFVRAKLVR